MAPINKKFRAVDALKLISSSSCSSSPPSSPSVSSPPSVIVRNDSQRLEPTTSYSCSDSEQVDPSRVTSLSQRDGKRDNEIISHLTGAAANVSQDLPIDATIGAKIDATIDTRKMIYKESTNNDDDDDDDDSNENSTQTNLNERDSNNSNAFRLTSKHKKVALFSPGSPPSPLQNHSQEQISAHRRSLSQQQQQQQQQQQYHHHQRHNKHSDYHSHHLNELRQRHSESPNNPEASLHHHLHSHLHVHPQQHLNIHNHHHPHATGNVLNINSQCIIPSPSNSPFEPTTSSPHQNPFNTFPFSPTSSAPSLPPSPASVITENIGYHKDSSCSSGPSAFYYDSNGIRTRADNSNSEPFPPEKSSKHAYTKRSNKSPSSISSLSNDLHSHRHVSFRMDAPSPTPSKSSTNSDSHKSSSSSGKGQVDKASEEYRLRRERNNIAVRKSRSKSKVKFIQTIDRMNQLEEENNKLHSRIEEMSREVNVLRLLVSKYHREDPRRLEHLEHLLAIEMSQEISILDVGNNRSQNRNYEDSRSNINPFFKER